MDNNDSMKPQQTGGLKLMTVFIAVLALHVLVIGGFTVYHLMGSSTGDADLTLDKTHKLKADGTAITDTTAPDAATTEKVSDTTAPSAAASSEPATTATPPAPAPEATPTRAADSGAPSATATNPPVTPAPTASPAAPAPMVNPSQDVAQSSAVAPSLAPPPEPTPGSGVIAPPPVPVSTPAPTTPAVASEAPAAGEVPAPEPPIVPSTSGPIMPDNPVASGPVHMPAVAPSGGSTPEMASTEEHAPMHEARHELYTVKITDSYKKIAHEHHLTVAQLKEANHIHDNVLHAGQKLIIPLERTSLAKADSSPEIGTASRVVLSDTDSTASLSASPATEHHRHHLYTVAKGDTLKYIARKFSVTTEALKEANNLSSAKLTAGEKLKIPSKEARSAGMTVPRPMQPSQVETQPTPIAPVVQPAPVEAPAPQPTPASTPELANLTF